MENVDGEILARSMKRKVYDEFLLRLFLPRFPRSACVQVPTSNILFVQDTKSKDSLLDIFPQVQIKRRSHGNLHLLAARMQNLFAN